MGSCLPPAATHHLRRHLPSWPNSTSSCPPFFTPLATLYNHSRLTTNHLRIDSSIRRHLHRSFPLSISSSIRRSGSRCRATSPGPPILDPPPPTSGFMSNLSRVQDTVRIFFAVLFWMSLFFWSCVWVGRNDGRPNNGSRFRR